MRVRTWVPYLLAALVMLSFPAQSQTAPSTDQLVALEVSALEFIGGGSPLSAQERQQAAASVAMGMHDDPAQWLAAERKVQQIMARVAQHNAPTTNALREELRYAYAFPAPHQQWPREFAIEKQIVDAHDPVVAIDPSHHRVVTRHMLQFFQQDAVGIARSFKIPPPAGDFMPILEKELRDNLASLQSTEPKIADGLAHMERNAWYGPVYFDHLSPANQKKFFVDDKDATFHNLGDHTSEQWQLAEAAAFLSRFAAAQAPAAGGNATMGERLLEQQMAQKAMTGALRGLSPGCNVTVGSYSDRAANNCYPH